MLKFAHTQTPYEDIVGKTLKRGRVHAIMQIGRSCEDADARHFMPPVAEALQGPFPSNAPLFSTSRRYSVSNAPPFVTTRRFSLPDMPLFATARRFSLSKVRLSATSSNPCKGRPLVTSLDQLYTQVQIGPGAIKFVGAAHATESTPGSHGANSVR